MHFLQEQGIRIPEDISVAGFDDSPWCERVIPELTSVRQDTEERARMAVKKLGELKSGVCKEWRLKMSVYLVERASVKKIG